MKSLSTSSLILIEITWSLVDKSGLLFTAIIFVLQSIQHVYFCKYGVTDSKGIRRLARDLNICEILGYRLMKTESHCRIAMTSSIINRKGEHGQSITFFP